MQRTLTTIIELQRKRKYFRIQIPKHLKALDKLLNQDFKIGSAVQVKYRGDTGKPKWPAEIVGIEKNGVSFACVCACVCESVCVCSTV